MSRIYLTEDGPTRSLTSFHYKMLRQGSKRWERFAFAGKTVKEANLNAARWAKPRKYVRVVRVKGSA